MKTLTELDLKGLYRAAVDSHKGQNGRLLVIGGSELFHASIFWSADVASRIVDLVHFSSPAMENNDLVRKKAKEGFWNGIVVPWEKVEEYINEDDCVLIGPGMPRAEGLEKEEKPTKEIVNGLLKKFANKRWVIDGGGLQECDPELLNKNMIITPHRGEYQKLLTKLSIYKIQFTNNFQISISKRLKGATILVKGKEDVVCNEEKCERISGGNEGMTKGGTGDVLAGLVAALYCKNEALVAARVGSLVNKQAGDNLYKRVGRYFNASDLVEEVARVMGKLLV